MKSSELGYGVQFDYIKVNPNFPQIAFWTLSREGFTCAHIHTTSTIYMANFQFYPIYFFNASRKICSAFSTIGLGFTSMRRLGTDSISTAVLHQRSSRNISSGWRNPPQYWILMIRPLWASTRWRFLFRTKKSVNPFNRDKREERTTLLQIGGKFQVI